MTGVPNHEITEVDIYRANEMTDDGEYAGSDDEGSIPHSENKSDSESSDGESDSNENRKWQK